MRGREEGGVGGRGHGRGILRHPAADFLSRDQPPLHWRPCGDLLH
ncbi:hypothetical protein D187_004557 [Cystobacter fuscus DSM 2262]|uniref:Uncharacterized protein n=1 Tax=Cystobacter fuscus (strain ATCC 25194 / DSM 2262 / NBRC 100088 / M29) TaxID=1242864 RepID=S9R651_CYSF2|nr:hypothetical protein D187_004557 [Cystobacter fuscus DSM 2262]